MKPLAKYWWSAFFASIAILANPADATGATSQKSKFPLPATGSQVTSKFRVAPCDAKKVATNLEISGSSSGRLASPPLTPYEALAA